MQYRLRTLLILLAIGPPMLAAIARSSSRNSFAASFICYRQLEGRTHRRKWLTCMQMTLVSYRQI